MTQELSIIENQEDFIRALNTATGYIEKLPFPKHLKFNADAVGKNGGVNDGMWMEETDEKDEEGKLSYKVIGDSIDIHIVIANRKMVLSDYDSKNKFYSHEYTGSYVDLYSVEAKKLIDSGNYKDLKTKYGEDLKFIQVLYVYYNNNPYRIKLSGSKLFNFFKLIKDNNPVLYTITASRGEKIKKSAAVSYYALDFKLKDLLDVKTVVERVNAVNRYIDSYNGAKNAPDAQILLNSGHVDDYFDYEPIIEAEMPQAEIKKVNEINMEDIPF